MFSFFRKPAPAVRPVITGETCAALLTAAIKGKTTKNFRLLLTKERMSCPTREDVRLAADRALRPWKRDVWECEDQARALVHEAQLIAANRGNTFAIGTLRADAPEESSHALHVFVWAVVSKGVNLRVDLFDATADDWADLPDVSGVDNAAS